MIQQQMSKGAVWMSIGKVLTQIIRQVRTIKTVCIFFYRCLIRQMHALRLRLADAGGQVADRK
jgi:hypothetical protein